MAKPSRSKGPSGGRNGTGQTARERRRIRASLAAGELEELPGFAGHLEKIPGSPQREAQKHAWDDASDEPWQEHQEFQESQEWHGAGTTTVPKSLVKFIVGLFLLPLAWVLTKTFLQAFTASIHHGLLATQTFGCFAAGMVLFGILFFIIPQNVLMVPYVLGHEVTHAIWARLFGGKVADHFHVSQEGGHVLTDRVNTWIILAPYFFPIYSVLVVTIYGAASFAADLSPYRWLLFLLLGVTLAFHLVFTCLLIAKGQPDLHYGGTFFSLTLIYLINLLLVTALLLVTSRSVTLYAFGKLFVENALIFAETCQTVAVGIIDWVSAQAASRSGS